MYSIGEVAEKIKVHQQTIRNWEKHGLIKLSRVGNIRIFYEEDLNLCRKIKELSGRGISLRGIRELMELRGKY